MKYEVPIYEKSNLTLEEAAAYFNIGVNKLRQLTDDDKCPFVLWVGSKRLIKRKKMDEYLSLIDKRDTNGIIIIERVLFVSGRSKSWQ